MNRIVVALLKPLSFLPALLVMYMIFSFSSQDGTESGQLSYKVSQKLVEVGAVILEQGSVPGGNRHVRPAVPRHGPETGPHDRILCAGHHSLHSLYAYHIRGIWLFLLQASSVWPLPPPTNTTRPW